MNAKLLLIDDDVAICDAMSATLQTRGYDVTCLSSGTEALIALERDEFQAVVTDINMPGMTGLEFCRRAHTEWPDLPVVLVTAFGNMETAVSAIRAGAYDFISKPIRTQELLVTLARALEHQQLKQENKRLRDTVARYQPPTKLIGESPVMLEVYAMLSRVTNSDVTVLITGESGTGKELIAHAVHEQGPHKAGPLVAFNCAAIPYTMLESELFGHTRGAFTDARTDHKGLFLQANGGTLFLDEIGEMTLATQVKLLRALQERKVRPVGGEREVPFNARVISATSRDLETDVAEQRFREDLYYRINVIRIHVPPLRARGNDVLVIAEHFVRVFAQHAKKDLTGIAAAAAQRLLGYPWPGNVRELRNCMERAVALTESDNITLDDLPEHIRTFKAKDFVLPLENPTELLAMDEVEKRYILQVIEAMNGSKTQAAAVLGFDRRTLYRKLKTYGVA
ncbi:MAG TPA: sigma-54 dependent transcriptional regulator [Polyangiales bacterium]|nr:sigma-54 dependent transcriptional regulator [Polyangiales bacterium]